MERKQNHVNKKVNQMVGDGSIRIGTPVSIVESASVVGKKEGEGPLGKLFDYVGQDDMFGGKTWEEAESALQKKAVSLCLEKSHHTEKDIRFIFAGDLLGQCIASSFGLAGFERPLLGVYGACSTSALSMTMGTLAVSSGAADKVICVTSSHFASAEKEFRFPLEYGNQRPLSATWTVTGSGAFLLGDGSEERQRAFITAMTPGKIVDYGVKDSMNMGACMAPAAGDVIYRHLTDFKREPSYYDRIVTGDLGYVGKEILIKLLKEKGFDIENQHIDCGIEIYNAFLQDTHSGGSGCGCAATVLSAYLLKQLEEKKWKRILFVPTGALLSKVSFNEGNTVPGIAHALALEGKLG